MLGSANMDLVVRQARRPAAGETVFGTSFSTGPGGKGLNQTIAAARAGAEVAFIGAVGDDEYGARLRARMEADGVDVGRLSTVSAPTGTAHISVTDDGENTIVVVPGANAETRLTAEDRAAIAAASYLLVQLERPIELIVEAMRLARDSDVTTVLTPAPVRADLAEVLALADVLIPNEGEALLLGGAADAESAAVALSRIVDTVIVTLGPRGALLAQRGALVRAVAPHVATALDTTGAGDTFVGVLAAWLAGGAGIDAALEAASAAAAVTVTREGAADAMPTRREIEARLRRS